MKDSKGNVVKKTTKKEIKNIGNGTDAIIDVDNNTAIINKIGAAKPKGMQATINNKVLSQLKEANNGKDLLLTMIVKDKDGNKRYSVECQHRRPDPEKIGCTSTKRTAKQASCFW